MNEEDCSLPSILYCYCLQQHIFLAFCKDFESHYRMFAYILLTSKTLSVFHLPKTSGNSGWDVNGTRLVGSFHWKFSGINRIPEQVVLFSRWKLPNGKFVFHLQISRLYHQFHAFRGLLNSQASLCSLVSQQKWRLIRVSFLEAFCKQTFRATTSALPATF